MLLDKRAWQTSFMESVSSCRYVETLFDRLDDIVFSIKDRAGRYVLVSQAAVVRCCLKSKQHAVGMTAFDLFPAPMAERYAQQDAVLFQSGRPIIDNLDLTLYRDRTSGWCLTSKEPLRNAAGDVIGLACISRDLNEPCRSVLIDADFADTIDYIHAHLSEPIRPMQLAQRCNLSQPQFDRRMRKLFQLSAGQYLLKLRIDAAAAMLVNSTRSIGEIAQLAGFCDQSGLSRHFRRLTGLTPGQYRQLLLR